MKKHFLLRCRPYERAQGQCPRHAFALRCPCSPKPTGNWFFGYGSVRLLPGYVYDDSAYRITSSNKTCTPRPRLQPLHLPEAFLPGFTCPLYFVVVFVSETVNFVTLVSLCLVYQLLFFSFFCYEYLIINSSHILMVI